jgi:hypothetical protein
VQPVRPLMARVAPYQWSGMSASPIKPPAAWWVGLCLPPFEPIPAHFGSKSGVSGERSPCSH